LLVTALTSSPSKPAKNRPQADFTPIPTAPGQQFPVPQRK
jgi:hypothetical protein